MGTDVRDSTRRNKASPARKKSVRKKKLEFSKIIMLVSIFINVSVIVFSCVMIWRTNDLSPLMYLIPSVAAEVATNVGYYHTKAGKENQIKLNAIYGAVDGQPKIEDASVV